MPSVPSGKTPSPRVRVSALLDPVPTVRVSVLLRSRPYKHRACGFRFDRCRCEGALPPVVGSGRRGEELGMDEHRRKTGGLREESRDLWVRRDGRRGGYERDGNASVGRPLWARPWSGTRPDPPTHAGHDPLLENGNRCGCGRVVGWCGGIGRGGCGGGPSERVYKDGSHLRGRRFSR